MAREHLRCGHFQLRHVVSVKDTLGFKDLAERKKAEYIINTFNINHMGNYEYFRYYGLNKNYKNKFCLLIFIFLE